MKYPAGISAAAAVLSASAARAATVSYSPTDGISYQVGIPASTASSGSGNIYFQISAPTTMAWVGLGTGSQMAGANIFVMYQDGNGNVTISPRAGTGHVEPEVDTSSTGAKLTLLEGSGVSGDTMTGNFMCSNCETWSAGTLSVTSSSVPFISAWKAGSSLASTDTAQAITFHDGDNQFSFDLSKATVEADSNPFVGAGASNGTSSGSTGATSSAGPNKKVIAAHGIGMALVFVVFYPLASLMMPLLGKWWIHGAVQGVSWLLMWACFGLGVFGAQERSLLFNNTHTLFGTVVVALLAIQPALGYIHHRQYIATQSRGVVSYVHIWWGRVLMALGVINGGLGLKLTNAPNSLNIAYAVVAAIVYLVYAIGKTVVSLRQNPRRGSRSTSSSRANKFATLSSPTAVEHRDDVPMNLYQSPKRR